MAYDEKPIGAVVQPGVQIEDEKTGSALGFNTGGMTYGGLPQKATQGAYGGLPQKATQGAYGGTPQPATPRTANKPGRIANPATNPVPTGKAPPPGVSPTQWANPVYKQIWLRNNPGYVPTDTPAPPGATTPLGGGGKGGFGGPGTGAGIGDTPTHGGGNVPGVGDAGAGGGGGIPPGVTPEQWANPIWKSIWLKNNPGWTGGGGTVPPGGTTPPGGTVPPGGSQPPGPATTPVDSGDPYASPFTGDQEQTVDDYVGADQTVQGQLERILESDSPLMRQAAARGRAAAQAKGMSGSSAAVGAVQGAMINAALPIAQQDAATYARFSENSQTADIAKDMSNWNFELEKRIKAMNIDSNEKMAIMSVVSGMATTGMEMMNNIMNNPAVTDKQSGYQQVMNMVKGWSNLFATFGSGGINWGNF